MPTLTATTILQRSLSALVARNPFLRNMATDFSTEAPLVLNQTVIAHVRQRPTVANYDGTTGYANGATSARTLLADIPILVDSHKHVPVFLDHLDAIQDQKDAFLGAQDDMGFELGKAISDSVLAKFTGSNCSYSKTYSTANSDLDAIEDITSLLNTNGAAPTGRIGIVNSDVAATLALDSRIASKDFYGTLTGASGLRVFRGVGGFEAIYEYPGMSANNAAGSTFTAATTDICTDTAHGFRTGDRVRLTTSNTLPAGLSTGTDYYVIRIDADTFKLATTDANATAGTAVDITNTGTGTHTITGYENITGVFFEPRAIALRVGLPAKSSELAAAMGIPQTMAMDSLSDPVSGLPLAFIRWMQPGTMDLYATMASIWGSAVGRQAGAAGAITDKAAVLLRSA